MISLVKRALLVAACAASMTDFVAAKTHDFDNSFNFDTSVTWHSAAWASNSAFASVSVQRGAANDAISRVTLVSAL